MNNFEITHDIEMQFPQAQQAPLLPSRVIVKQEEIYIAEKKKQMSKPNEDKK